MRHWISTWISLLGLAVMIAAFPASSPAQQLKAAGKRRIVSQSPLVYPPIARKMRLSGTVRLCATVAPGGKVVHVEVLGGSPVLAQSATDAVSTSKWESGADETKEIVEIKFEPDTD
jgi:TonB family protein